MKITGVTVQRDEQGKTSKNATIALYTKLATEKFQKELLEFSKAYDEGMENLTKWEPIFYAALVGFWANPRNQATREATFPRKNIVMMCVTQMVNDGSVKLDDMSEVQEMFESYLLDNCGTFESGAWMDHTGGKGPKAGQVKQWKRDADAPPQL